MWLSYCYIAFNKNITSTYIYIYIYPPFPTLKLDMSFMLLLLAAGNKKEKLWGGLQWHNIHTKFCEDQSHGSSFKSGNTHVISQAYFFPFQDVK
jgi:phosphoribosyl 1,2-cyclic phosphodiesterase